MLQALPRKVCEYCADSWYLFTSLGIVIKRNEEYRDLRPGQVRICEAVSRWNGIPLERYRDGREMSNMQSGIQMDEKNTGEAEQLTVTTAIANLQQKTDLGARYYAAWWLGKFRVRDSAAIDALLAALEDESDRAPDGGYPLRRNSARALGKLGDKRAVLPLIRCLEFPDFYVREAAAQALENLDDKSCIPALMALLTGGVEAARFVPGKPHLIQPYEAAIEALGTLGAVEAMGLIQPFIEHSVDKVKYAAARAMYQLTKEDRYGNILIRALSVEDLQLRRSALMDLAAVGYLPAGKAIAETLAENSMKLIALKGLLETNLQTNRDSLSKDSIEIMDLMDSLL